MFQFPACPPRRSAVPGYHPGRVAPFGDLGIAGCQRLPRAFRRVAASFLGRRRQGIHRAPIFADCPSVIAPRSRRSPAGSRGPPARAGSIRPVSPVPADRGADTRGGGAGTPPRPSVVKVRGAPRRWSRGDSNPGPPPCKGGALPAKLRPRNGAVSQQLSAVSIELAQKTS
jgi:hypothetical protein